MDEDYAEFCEFYDVPTLDELIDQLLVEDMHLANQAYDAVQPEEGEKWCALACDAAVRATMAVNRCTGFEE